MLTRYTSEQGFACGVELTFDTEHPCPLCKKVDEANQKDKEPISPPSAPSSAAMKWATPTAILALPVATEVRLITGSIPLEALSDSGRDRAAPPKPPPRIDI